MAIRLRRVQGKYIALCAVESDPKEGDIYLDDGMHGALSTKFAQDFNDMFDTKLPVDNTLIKLMNSQKVRDAKEEFENWHNQRLCDKLNKSRHQKEMDMIQNMIDAHKVQPKHQIPSKDTTHILFSTCMCIGCALVIGSGSLAAYYAGQPYGLIAWGIGIISFCIGGCIKLIEHRYDKIR